MLIACSHESRENINFRNKNISLSNYEVIYESGNWDHPDYSEAFESYGNHRAVIELQDTLYSNTQVLIPWRRRDNEPAQKDIIIVDAKTNTVVENRYVIEINNEYGHLIFKPNNQSSLYYVYYLPHSSTGSYYPKVSYKKPKETKDKSWLAEIKLSFCLACNRGKRCFNIK